MDINMTPALSRSVQSGFIINTVGINVCIHVYRQVLHTIIMVYLCVLLDTIVYM